MVFLKLCNDFLLNNFDRNELESKELPRTVISTHAKDLLNQLDIYLNKFGKDLSCIVFVRRRYSAFTLSALINYFYI